MKYDAQMHHQNDESESRFGQGDGLSPKSSEAFKLSACKLSLFADLKSNTESTPNDISIRIELVFSGFVRACSYTKRPKRRPLLDAVSCA